MALSQAQRKLLEASVEAARELGERGKALTGLIGELSACQDQHLTWEPSNGYDAKRGDLRVQIKTARSPTAGYTMGWFGRKKKTVYLFDEAVYVELDANFNVAGIWHMDGGDVEQLERSESSTWGVRIKRFKSVAKN